MPLPSHIKIQTDTGTGRNRIEVFGQKPEELLCGDTGELNSKDGDLTCTLKALYYAIERIGELETKLAAMEHPERFGCHGSVKDLDPQEPPLSPPTPARQSELEKLLENIGIGLNFTLCNEIDEVTTRDVKRVQADVEKLRGIVVAGNIEELSAS